MTPRALLKQLAAGRVAMGGSLLVAPQLIGAIWLGKDGGRATVRVLARGFGARDAALGAGVLTAIGGGDAALRPWVLAGIVSDAADLTATLIARDQLPRRAVPLLVALAGGAIAVGAANLASGDDTPQTQV